MKNLELAKKFLIKADQDIIVVQKWYKDPEIADEILGFHAQQSAEKMLKAVLVYKGVEFPRTHRLTDLIDLSREKGIHVPEKLEDIRFLTPFAVEFRYENLYEEEDEHVDFEKVVVLLMDLRKWVKTVIDE